MNTPNGRAAVNALYGNPAASDGTLSESWESANLMQVDLPYPMRIAWQKEQVVRHIRVHRLAKDAFTAAFNAAWEHARLHIKNRDGYDKDTAYYDKAALQWLQSLNLDLYGGAFNFRAIRGNTGLSLHSYGIAIDIDPDHNPLGAKTGTLPDWFIKCWKDAGFFWGGDFKSRKDLQHFQLATGV